MSGDAQLLLMVAGLHVLALVGVAVLLIPALRDAPDATRPTDSGSEDGGGPGPRRPPTPPEGPRGGVPLADAEQARVRLREPGRLADCVPARDRRPVREPERVRSPASSDHG